MSRDAPFVCFDRTMEGSAGGGHRGADNNKLVERMKVSALTLISCPSVSLAVSGSYPCLLEPRSVGERGCAF